MSRGVFCNKTFHHFVVSSSNFALNLERLRVIFAKINGSKEGLMQDGASLEIDLMMEKCWTGSWLEGCKVFHSQFWFVGFTCRGYKVLLF